MHVSVDSALRHDVVVGIAATAASSVVDGPTKTPPPQKEKHMSDGLDEVFPPPPEVWAEMARNLISGDHQLGKAVQFIEEGATDSKVLAQRLQIKPEYADFLLSHARKMKSGAIRVRVTTRNDGHETASNQAHHYRYLLACKLSAETQRYVEAVIAKFRSVNSNVPMTAAYAQGPQPSYERDPRADPALCTNTECEWSWTRHGGPCS